MQSVLLLILFIRHPFCVCFSQWFSDTRNNVQTDCINVIHITGSKKFQPDSKLIFFFVRCHTASNSFRHEHFFLFHRRLIYSTSIAAVNGSHASRLVFAFFIREILADSTSFHKVFNFISDLWTPKFIALKGRNSKQMLIERCLHFFAYRMIRNVICV